MAKNYKSINRKNNGKLFFNPSSISLVRLTLIVLSVLLVSFDVRAQLTQINIAGPAGSGSFGTLVQTLPNGNIVVTDPDYDQPSPAVQNVGAVYLYNGASGALISTLTGSTAEDQIGSAGLLITGSNYVVRSPNWDSGSIANAGAATFCSGASGCSGVVSPSNSLIGSKAADQVGGSGAVVLTNGNYLIVSTNWDNGTIVNAGAVTFGSGTAGISGPVSAANSLVGSTADDQVGNRGVYPLNNGNYVVGSSLWNNGTIVDAGAATFGSGASGIAGPVSAANSLVGSTNNDQVTGGQSFSGGQTYHIGITPLANGNYVVSSPDWDNGATANVGAATFGSGTSGISGTISAANSLIGSTALDQVGGDFRGVTALVNGNYVVGSPNWHRGSITDAGAATFGNGTIGITGIVTIENSLVGSATGDRVGGGGSETPGYDQITPLTNGNYVVSSPLWNNGTIADAGAATFGSGTTGVSGPVSAANSLVGSTAGDQVSGNTFSHSVVTALVNGNYVVGSERWDKGSIVDVGAVTFSNGQSGTVGAVTAANSMTGTTAGDILATSSNGFNPIIALPNGNYVVGSPSWHNGTLVEAGAATLCSGVTGCPATISAANSLVGSKAGDNVASYKIIALTNGNYVVVTQFNDNGNITSIGAVTFGNGMTGTNGTISATNSVLGSATSDVVGAGTVLALPGGNYAFSSPFWNNAGLADAGAVTFGRSDGSTVGSITANNSIRGTKINGGPLLNFVFDAVNAQLVVGRPADNIVTLARPAGLIPANNVRPPFDFDGDGKSDISVFRPTDANWYVMRYNSTYTVANWGTAGDKPAPADFDGDGKTDYAVFRENGFGDPDKAYFFILKSSDNTVQTEQFGRAGDDPSAVGDWDGDGKADVAVYRGGAQAGAASYFYYHPSAQPAVGFKAVPWGIGGDLQTAGDYDGDGKLDAAVFRPSNAVWYVLRSSDGALQATGWGLGTDKPVVRDFDGDGKTDLTVFRDGNWYVLQSLNNQFRAISWGLGTDTLVPADYDGDGKADAAVFRNGTWFILRSSDAQAAIVNFGSGSDTAIPSTR